MTICTNLLQYICFITILYTFTCVPHDFHGNSCCHGNHAIDCYFTYFMHTTYTTRSKAIDQTPPQLGAKGLAHETNPDLYCKGTS